MPSHAPSFFVHIAQSHSDRRRSGYEITYYFHAPASLEEIGVTTFRLQMVPTLFGIVNQVVATQEVQESKSIVSHNKARKIQRPSTRHGKIGTS